ncbi:hypothetical protein BGZ94_000966 [Podila epigama]|nr:hypothetical protein BGZ94_000966 [Podila epigama]
MQDENAIEAHLGPKPLKSPTIIKNKPEVETDAEGAPPRKTQKLSHLSPSQLLARTPFNPVANTPNKKHTSPSIGQAGAKVKQGSKNASGHPEHPKSQTPTESDVSPVQTRLNFTAVPRNTQAAAVNDDAIAVESLENTLNEYKQLIKVLQDELAQETGRLKEQRAVCNEQEETLMIELNVAERELSILKDQEAEQVEEMSRLDNQLTALGLENENMALDLHELEVQVNEYEEKTAQELSRSELEILTEEIMALDEETSLVMADMELQCKLNEELELRVDPVAGEGLLQDIHTLESDIRHLEEMIREEGAEPEIPLDLSIEEEFDVLAARFKLPRHSDTEKKLLEAQRKIKDEYYRQLNALKFKHSAKMEQIQSKTSSHVSRLQNLRTKIALADETISRSSKELEEIRQERQNIMAQCDALH